MMTPEEASNFDRMIGLMEESAKMNAKFIDMFVTLNARIDLLEQQVKTLRTSCI